MLVNRDLTEEEQAINDAIDDHRDAMKDEFQVMLAAGVAYFAGFVLTIVGAQGSRTERIGNALFIVGLVLILINVLLGLRTRKKREAVHELMDPYLRRQALPFFNELTEMFADKPGIHLHLAENGKIIVTDRRKPEEENNGSI